MSKAVVYDIDGVVSTGDGPLDRRKPNKKVLRRINGQSKDGKKVFYNTNRPKRFQKLTEEWLASHGAANDGVYMPTGKGHVGNKQHNLDRLARKHKIEEVWENDERIIRGVKGHPVRHVKEIDKGLRRISKKDKGDNYKNAGAIGIGVGSSMVGSGMAGFKNEYTKGKHAGLLASPQGIEHGFDLPKKSGPFTTKTDKGTRLVGVKSPSNHYIAGSPRKLAPIAVGASLVAAGAGLTQIGRKKAKAEKQSVAKRVSAFGVEI